MKTTTSSFGSEDDWTARLKNMLSVGSDVITGIGDDAAVIRLPGGSADLVYTTDAVVEGIHFIAGTEPKRIGHKIVGRLLSDLAAMGAEPDHMLLNLVVGPSHSQANLIHIYEGAEALASSFGASIVGGDTIKGDVLALHGFAAGHVPKGAAVLRSGAAVGDRIYVTGELGGSIAGKHLDFIPRVREGIWLREGGWATAMMDLSDGLARDLRRLCAESGTGAEVWSESIPVASSVDRTGGESDLLQHVLCDGEDYELLFTVKKEKAEGFETAWAKDFDIRCTCIGVMSDASDNLLIKRADGDCIQLLADGYDHLAEDDSDK